MSIAHSKVFGVEEIGSDAGPKDVTSNYVIRRKVSCYASGYVKCLLVRLLVD